MMCLRSYLIFLDQRKLVSLEEGSTSVNGIGAASVQLGRFPLVDGGVASLLKLWGQKVVKVVALDLLPGQRRCSAIRLWTHGGNA